MRSRKQHDSEDENFSPRPDSKRDRKGRDRTRDSARRAKVALTFIGRHNVREQDDVEAVKGALFKGTWIPVRHRGH